MDDKAKSKVREAQLVKYHAALDRKLYGAKAHFQTLLSDNDITGYWKLWNWAVEDSFCETFVPKGKWKRVKGRGHSNIKQQDRCQMDALAAAEDDANSTLVDVRFSLLNKQAER